MSVANICIIIAIVVYLAAMVIVGIVCSKKNNSVDDFYLGGRQLGPLVTAMSAEASDMSGWLLMGMPGLAYLCGIAEASWTAIGLAIGTYLNWLIVAKRLRNYSSRIGAITIPDFFGKRFKDNTHVLMFASALLIIIFFIPYTASGFSTCGKLFSSLFGLDYHVAVIVSAIVIVLYTTLGGFLAASTTDFIQAIIMTIALIAVLCFGNKSGRRLECGCGKRKINSTLPFFNINNRRRRKYGSLRRIYHCFYSCLGARLFWYASYPSSLYGN